MENIKSEIYKNPCSKYHINNKKMKKNENIIIYNKIPDKNQQNMNMH